MRTVKLLCTAFSLSALAFVLPAQAARVDVVFVNPESFTDAVPTYYPVVDGSAAAERSRDLALSRLKERLLRLGEEYLREGDHLSVEVLDIDLAGMLEPRRSGYVRTLRDSTPPRLNLRYTLVRSGVEVRGADQISDLQYLEHRGSCSADPVLCHETRLIDDWFLQKVLKGNLPKQTTAR